MIVNQFYFCYFILYIYIYMANSQEHLYTFLFFELNKTSFINFLFMCNIFFTFNIREMGEKFNSKKWFGHCIVCLCLITSLVYSYFSYIKLSQNNRKVISAWKNAFISASPALIAGLGTSFSIHLSKTLRRYLGCVTFNRCITTLYKLGTVVELTLKICISCFEQILPIKKKSHAWNLVIFDIACSRGYLVCVICLLQWLFVIKLHIDWPEIQNVHLLIKMKKILHMNRKLINDVLFNSKNKNVYKCSCEFAI